MNSSNLLLDVGIIIATNLLLDVGITIVTEQCQSPTTL